MSAHSTASRRQRASARKNTPKPNSTPRRTPTQRPAQAQQRSAQTQTTSARMEPLLPRVVDATPAPPYRVEDILQSAEPRSASASANVSEDAPAPTTSQRPAGVTGPLPPLPTDVSHQSVATSASAIADSLPRYMASRGWVALPMNETPSGFSRVIERFPGWSPFRLSERDWRRSPLARRIGMVPAAAVMLILLLFISGFAFVMATHANHAVSAKAATFTPPAAPTAGQPSVVTIQQPPRLNSTATPAAEPYLIGVWLSDSSPGATAGTETVYVRVTNNSVPMVGALIRLSVSDDNGTSTPPSIKTGPGGIATFTVHYSNAGPGHPVFFVASTVIGGKSFAAQTTIIAG